MREKELREHATCDICGQPIGRSGLPLFWTVKIERHGLLAGPLQRQQGLAMVLGGNGLLAQIMGPDEEMTKLMDSREITACETCSQKTTSLVELLMERGG